jgi:hypothetical protein
MSYSCPFHRKLGMEDLHFLITLEELAHMTMMYHRKKHRIKLTITTLNIWFKKKTLKKKQGLSTLKVSML